MELAEDAQEEIQDYFKIDERIKNIEKRIARIQESFYDQTMTTYTASDGLEIISIGFNLERKVIPYVDEINALEEAIRYARLKKRYLNDYLSTLEPSGRDYLIKKYSGAILTGEVEQADIDLYEEILEIDDAINFMRGYPVRKRVDNEMLEDDFEDITILLGV